MIQRKFKIITYPVFNLTNPQATLKLWAKSASIPTTWLLGTRYYRRLAEAIKQPRDDKPPSF